MYHHISIPNFSSLKLIPPGLQNASVNGFYDLSLFLKTIALPSRKVALYQDLLNFA